MPAGRFTRPACRSARAHGRGRRQDSARPGYRSTTCSPSTCPPRRRCLPRDRAGFADVHPGRGPRHVPLVDAGGELHTAGWSIGRGRTRTRSTGLACWPWMKSRQVCFHEDRYARCIGKRQSCLNATNRLLHGRGRRQTSRGRVVDRVQPRTWPPRRRDDRPGSHGPADGRSTTGLAIDRPGAARARAHHAGEDSDTLAAGFADVHPGRGPRHAPLVDAGGELHAAGWSIGRGSEQRPV